ncbi:MAG: hypothetical protein IPL61_26055 [Myxococcales bacterium]|nr:hypothetical protein [Myxococcales bacterium]
MLTATPSGGAVFSGWSGGGCSGTGTCATTITAAVTVTATFAAGMCDSFSIGNTTTIPGWTERAGDWVVSGGLLRDSTGTSGTIYSRHITMDNSTQTDGCVRFTAVYSGAGTIASAGAILRWTPPMNYIVALVQDNTNSGTWNTGYIYQYPAVTSLTPSISGAWGTTPAVEACVNGTTVTLRVDAARDGVYESSAMGTTTLTGAGLSGIMTLSASSAVDDVCWGP